MKQIQRLLNIIHFFRKFLQIKLFRLPILFFHVNKPSGVILLGIVISSAKNSIGNSTIKP